MTRRPRHHHRQLQHARRSRRVPGVAARAPARARSRDVVVVDNASTDGSVDAGPRALAAASRRSRSTGTSASRAANNVAHSRSRSAARPAAQQRHASCRPARSTRSSSGSTRRGAVGGRPAAGRRRRPARSVVRPDADAAGRARASALRVRLAARRDAAGARATSRGSLADERVGRLGQRRVPARAPRRGARRRPASTSATSCTKRTSTSARRCARAAAASCSRRAAEVVHLRGRSVRRRRPRGRAALRPQPPRVLREAPARAGRRCCGCWLRAARPAPSDRITRSHCAHRHRRPQAARLRHRDLRPEPACSELARQDDDRHYVLLCRAGGRGLRPRRSARGSSRWSNASGNYSVREQFSVPLALRAGARRSVSRAALRRLAAHDAARSS